MLLVVRCIRLRQATEKAVYLITAPGAIDYALLADIAAGRKPYTEARRRPEVSRSSSIESDVRT